jgi:serine/threonine protein kinase
MSNIILTVFHLNSQDIFHRDIKPENFLIKKESNGKTYLHLTNFGFAKYISAMKRFYFDDKTIKIPYEYLPPEIYNNEPSI